MGPGEPPMPGPGAYWPEGPRRCMAPAPMAPACEDENTADGQSSCRTPGCCTRLAVKAAPFPGEELVLCGGVGLVVSLRGLSCHGAGSAASLRVLAAPSPGGPCCMTVLPLAPWQMRFNEPCTVRSTSHSAASRCGPNIGQFLTTRSYSRSSAHVRSSMSCTCRTTRASRSHPRQSGCRKGSRARCLEGLGSIRCHCTTSYGRPV